MPLYALAVGNTDASAPPGGIKVQPIDLATLDPTGLLVGDGVADTDGNLWVLTASTQTVDHINAEAVAGCAGLRWIKEGSGSNSGGSRFSAEGYPGIDPSGVSDSTVGIQSLINAAYAARDYQWYSVFFPMGTYTISARIQVPGSARIYGEGATTRFVASAGLGSDWMFSKTGGSQFGPMTFEHFSIRNTNLGGGCIDVSFLNTADFSAAITIHDIFFDSFAGTGFAAIQAFDCNITNCKFFGLATGIGIKAAMSGRIMGCDFQGCLVGAQLAGGDIHITGTRAEVNTTVFLLGKHPDGSVFSMQGVICECAELEGNGAVVTCFGPVNISRFAQLNATGVTGQFPGGGRGQTAFHIIGDRVTLDSVEVPGDYDIGIRLGRNSVATLRNCKSYPTGGRAWQIDCNANDLTWDGFSPYGQAPMNWNGSAIRSLHKFDAVSGPKPAKNLSGQAIMATGTTSIDVAFPPAINANTVSVFSVTPAAGGSLAAGTYTYTGTMATEVGECSGARPGVSGTTSGGNLKLNVVLFPAPGPPTYKFSQRLYRSHDGGTTWDGYFDLGHASTFTDDGTVPLITSAGPSTNIDSPSGAESDALYSVVVTSEADLGRIYVPTANKTTTGFRITCTTAAAADTVVHWLLFR